MRKVLPENEIPVTELTEAGIEKRKKGCEFTLSPSLVKRTNAVQKYLERISDSDESLDVDTFVARVFKLVDDICEPISKNSVCRKGCAHCCKVVVGVTSIEAAYIHSKTGIEMNNLKRPSFRNHKAEHDYCPLLDQETGMCSIYEYRPLHCRSFFTIDDPKECESTDNAHFIFSAESSEAIKFLRSRLEIVSKMSNYAELADIRDWIKKDG